MNVHTEANLSLKRVLPLASVVFYGFAYLIPTSVFDMYGIVSSMTHGMLALTHLVTAIAMIFTAYSFGRMAAVYPISGSSYTYVQRAISPYLGFLTGWALLSDYLLIPMLSYVIAANYVSTVFPQIPSWVWVVLFAGTVTFITHIGIKVTAWVNNIIVLFQFFVLLVVVFFMCKHLLGGGGAATFFDWSAFYNARELHQEGAGFGVIFSGASILVLSYLGFDAVTTLAEETINPRVTIGRGVMIICAGAGIAFTIISYFLLLSWPTGWQEFADVNTASLELFKRVGLDSLTVIYPFLAVIGALAGPLAAQTSCSRMLYSMGRDNILPKKFFGYLHPKRSTPTFSILFIGGISMIASFLDLTTAISLVNFGALFGFTFVNIAVIFHYFIKENKRSGFNLVRYLIVPLIGAGVCLTFLLNLDGNAKTVGFVWLGIGLIYLAIHTNFFRKLPPELKLDQ
ncbi:APC family permease [Brevibacillus fluminis]|uniref:APC family permease n=1 Tax=Brevibacillus fluminis TaxID=511487 RepID=UPI003F8C3C77